ETGALRDPRSAIGERLTAWRGAAILPHDRSMHGPSGRALPDDYGLALIRETDRDGCRSRRRNRVPRRAANTLENLERVVLDPARAREVLRNLSIAATGDAAVFTDREARRARCAFVDREHVLHTTPPVNSYGGRCTPRSLTIAVINSAGVTSNAGL